MKDELSTGEVQFCPECEQMSGRRTETREEIHTVRGMRFKINTSVAVCMSCGKDVWDAELDSVTQERLFSAYRQYHGVLAPWEIKALRERYGLSQRAFGRLLGWGEVTIHRYETGALPDLAHNSLLRLLQDEGIMIGFLEQQQDRLTVADKRHIADATEGRMPAIGTAAIRRGVRQVLEARSPLQRGNQRFSFDRFAHMVVYFAGRGAPARTKLNKLLWYADFLAFKRLTVSLSGVPYLRFPYGPVPERYLLLFAEVESEGLATCESVVWEGPTDSVEGTQYHALVSFNEDLFTPRELAVLATVHDHFSSKNAREIADISHRERAWLETPDRDVIAYTFAAHLSLD